MASVEVLVEEAKKALSEVLKGMHQFKHNKRPANAKMERETQRFLDQSDMIISMLNLQSCQGSVPIEGTSSSSILNGSTNPAV
ncbi:hypothetical protein ACH5RR_033145 [Cinchona calisaya]|uniref:Uncharacterized protein n=1 Tax=Cinchona calisaya TaxID=153742 RepID=A0ABD2YK57_9GENT